jgi:putative transposase
MFEPVPTTRRVTASWNAGMDRSLKSECIRPSSPGTKEEAERRIAKYVKYYNTVRLHSAIGYITPADCLAGLSEVIGQERDRKLEAARKLRQEKRAASKQVA